MSITIGLNDSRANLPINQRSLMIGSSLDCQYLPCFAIYTGKYMSAKGMSYIEYALPELPLEISRYTSDKYRYMNGFISNSKIPSLFNKFPIHYWIFKDTIFYIRDSKPVILMTLVVEWDYLLKTNYFKDVTTSIYNSNSRNIPLLDYSKFKLLVNNDLINNGNHKNFLTYLRRYTFREYSQEGVDIIYTDHMDRYIFKQNNLPIRFRTLALMNNYFEDLTKTSIDEFTTAE